MPVFSMFCSTGTGNPLSIYGPSLNLESDVFLRLWVPVVAGNLSLALCFLLALSASCCR